MGDYAPHLIQQILQHAGTDWDFEKFCVRHYSHIEGCQYLPTSRNYDVGIDGDMQKRRTKGGSYIVASIQKRDGLVGKAVSDVRRLLKADPHPAKVRICLSQLNSNEARLEIKKAVKKICGRAEYEVSGIAELVDEVERNSGAFAEVYENPVDEARRQMERHANWSPSVARRLGFRVLLGIQLEGSAVDLRRRILRGIVLQVIPSAATISRQDLLRAVSDAIGVDRPIQTSYLCEVLTSLETDGFIEVIDNDAIKRRRAADDPVIKAGEHAASKILDGYGSFKQALDARLDAPLSAKQYAAVWTIVKRGLVKLFREYGIEIVGFVLRLNGDTEISAAIPTSLYEGFQHIAENLDVARVSLTDGQRAKLMRSIPDALLDNTSGTRRWVARLCLAYLCACSLGLHPDALKRLEVQLRTWDVIPDTHVILSALGEGEPDHSAINQLLKWWVESGGRLHSIEPVLDETLHHAELGLKIADNWAARYRRCRGKWRPPIPQSNVFLRCVAKRHIDPGPSNAQSYLGQFLGSVPDRFLKLKRILEEEYGFTPAPQLQVDASFQDQLYSANAKIRLRDSYDTDEERQNAEARCSHDAATLAYLSVYRQSIGSERTAIILSHSSHLRRVCDQFKSRFGLTSSCIDPGRLLFTLSLNPGTVFSLVTIESALFGEIFQRQVALNEGQAQEVADRFISQEPKDVYTSTLKQAVEDRLIGGPKTAAMGPHRVGRGVLRRGRGGMKAGRP